jgi:hypothetical protein
MGVFTYSQVARILNEQKLRTGAGDSFTTASVKWIRFSANLKSLKEQLLDSGWLTVKQASAQKDFKKKARKVYARPITDSCSKAYRTIKASYMVRSHHS